MLVLLNLAMGWGADGPIASGLFLAVAARVTQVGVLFRDQPPFQPSHWTRRVFTTTTTSMYIEKLVRIGSGAHARPSKSFEDRKQAPAKCKSINVWGCDAPTSNLFFPAAQLERREWFLLDHVQKIVLEPCNDLSSIFCSKLAFSNSETSQCYR